MSSNILLILQTTVNSGVQVNLLNLKKIFKKLGIDLYVKNFNSNLLPQSGQPVGQCSY